MTLNIYWRRAREGKELLPALDFARFVCRSGIPQLLNANSCDGNKVRFLADQIMEEVQERFRTKDAEPHVSHQEFQTLHEKFDLLAGYLARVMTVLPPVPVVESKPELKVISGGLDATQGNQAVG